MRQLFAVAILLAICPALASGSDGEYVLRVAHKGYDNWLAGSAEPVEKEIDSMEHLIRLGEPFAVAVRTPTAEIKITGVLKRERDKSLLLDDFSYSCEAIDTNAAGRSVIACETRHTVMIGKQEVIFTKSGSDFVERDGQWKSVRSRDTCTCTVTDAAGTKGRFKPEQTVMPPGADYAPGYRPK
jgi:hypothetical protein